MDRFIFCTERSSLKSAYEEDREVDDSMGGGDRNQVIRIAKKIRTVILGGVGVLFPATVFIDSEKEVLRQRSHVDGQGISFLRSAGLRIAFTTAGGDEEPFINVLANRMNSLDSVKSGTWEPVALFKNVAGLGRVHAIADWMNTHDIPWQECVPIWAMIWKITK